MLMKKNLRFLFVALMAMVFAPSFAQEVTIDFSGSTDNWGIGTTKLVDEQSFSYNGLTITLKGTTGNGYRWYDSGNIILGKEGATLTLPAFSFDVERIDVVGISGASASVKQNIFVNDEAVSTETTGAKDVTNQYAIPEGKQAAGTIYTLKVLSNHNTQITKILVWKKGTASQTDPEPPAEIQEITVAQALEYCNALEDGKTSTEEYRVKGFVVGTPDIQKKADGTFYGNANFYFADEKGGATTIYAFRIKGLNNENIESETYIQDGDELTVQCKLQKYVKNDVVTPELVQGYIYAKGNGSETSGQVWDFTVLPTQKIDGTGNLATNAADGVLVEDEGAAWAIIYNVAGIEDGTEFTASNGVTFEPTKGLKWSALPNDKMVIYRNYPANYGGKYLFTNKACEVMIPAKAGQVIEIIAGTAKNNKKITSQDVEETFTTDDGETLKGVVVDGTVNYDYKPYTLTVKVANPYISFENNICIQKITVKDAGTSSVKTIQNVTRQNGVRYNLSGQKVGDDYKGIVIMNGKKYMVK